MAATLGDVLEGPAYIRTEASDGTNMTAGDAVTQDGSQQVTPTGDGDDLYGVVIGPANDGVDLSNLSAGDNVSVLVHGAVVANAGGSVTRGDLLETSSTAGQLAQNGVGTEQDVDEGGTATYTLALQTAKALSNSGGTTPAGESLGTNEAAILVL